MAERRGPRFAGRYVRPWLETLEARVSPVTNLNLQQNLFGALGQLGTEIQDTVGQVFNQQTGLGSLPFTNTALTSILNLPQTFHALVSQLTGPAMITGANTPAFVLADTPLAVSINHATPVLIDIAAGSYVNTAGVASALGTALGAAGLSGQVMAGTGISGGNPVLTLQTTPAALGSTIGLTELELAAGSGGPTYGQPGVDVTFNLSFTTKHATTLGGSPGYVTNIDNVTVSLPASSTSGDVTMSDLAGQLNTAFSTAFTLNPTETELQNLYAEVEPGSSPLAGNLVFVSTDPDVTGITITDPGGGNLSTLGFTSGQAGTTAASALNLTNAGATGISGVLATPLSSFDPTMNASADSAFKAALAAISSSPLPLSYDPGWNYNGSTSQVTFTLDVNKTFTSPVALDFTHGLSLGPLGTLQITAMASASATASLDLSLTLGIFLGLPTTTSLATLNAGTAPGDVGAGSGIPTGAPDGIVITIGGGSPITVSLTGASTVQDVINDIQTATASAITVSVNAMSGLSLMASGNQTVTVTADGGSTDAAALGLLGVTSANGLLAGSSLYGQSVLDRVSLATPSTLSLNAGLQASTLHLDAALGMLQIGIGATTPVQVGASFGVSLLSPLTFHALGQALATPTSIGSLVSVSGLTFNAQGELGLSASLGSTALLPSGSLATLDIGLSNPSDLSSITFTPDTTGLTDALMQLDQLSPEQLLTIVTNLLSSFTSSSSIPFFNQKLELLGNKSLNEILGLGDKLLTVFQNALSGLDTSAVQNAYNAAETALTNLDLPLVDMGATDAIQTALGTLQGVLSGPASTLPSRLISAAAEVNDALGAFVLTGDLPGTDSLLVTLESAVSNLQSLVPSINNLLSRLQSAVTALLPPGSQFHLAWAPYHTGSPSAGNALVASLTLSGQLSLGTVTPAITAGQFGPVQLSGSFNGSLAGGGTITIGLGLAVTDTGVTPVVLTDPSVMLTDANGMSFTPATNLSLKAGLSGSITGSVTLGGLSLAQGTIALNLLSNAATDEKEEKNLSVTSTGVNTETFTLTAAPAANTPLIVYDQAGNILPPDEYDPPDGSTTTFTITSDTLPTMVSVDYQTSTSITATNSNAASFGVGFVSGLGTALDGNTLGAIPFTNLVAVLGTPSDVTITSNGILAGSVAVSALGGPQTQVLAVGSTSGLAAPGSVWIPNPQIGLASNLLGDLTQNIGFNLTTIVNGISSFLQTLETGLTSDIISKLPVIGGGLNMAGTFIGKLRDQFVVPFQTFLNAVKGGDDQVGRAIAKFIFDKLGPGGLNILGARNGGGTPTVHDVIVTLDEQHFEIQFTLAGEDTLMADLNSGLAGLPFQAQGGLTLSMKYKVDLGIGVDRSGTVYLITDAPGTPEIDLSLDAGLSVDHSTSPPTPTSLMLTILGLTFSGTDILGPGPAYHPGTDVNASVTLTEMPSSGNHLLISDILNNPFGMSFQVGLNASASLALHLDASIDPNLPNVSTDLKGSIGISLMNKSDGTFDVMITPPTIGFYNVTLNFGAFLTKYIGPIIAKVEEFIKPIEPLVQFLESEVPGISDLSKAVGNGPIKVMDLVKALDPGDFDTAAEVLRIVEDIIQVAHALGTNYGQLGISFGDFVLGGGDGVDVTQAGWNDSSGSQAQAVNNALEDPPSGNNDTPRTIVGGIPALQSLVSTLHDMGITLAFLEPKTIFKYLIGQTADIVTWDIPKLEVNFDWSTSFLVWAFPPVALTVGLHFDAFIQLSVGYDTYGLKTGHFLDGLFFGTAHPLAGFGLGVTLGAELDLGIASAGIQGEILGEISGSWNDRDMDGKMRLPEIASFFQHGDVQCLILLSADVRAIVDLVYSVGIGPFSFSGKAELLNIVLWSFMEKACPDTQTAHVSGGGEQLPSSDLFPGGQTSTKGELIVHAGPFASLREAGASDTDEKFTVTQTAPGVFDVQGMGLDNNYTNVTSIFFDGGAGNNEIDLIGVTVPATLLGGPGNDTLNGGGGNNVIDGLTGRAIITGGPANNTIYGGGGNDLITGSTMGSGTDSITGGSGNDTILGGSHTSTIFGGTGNDIIFAGSGSHDSVTGGSGEDLIYGYSQAGGPASGGAKDTLIGGTGNDCIVAGNGGDLLFSGTGNSLLLGGTGFDTLLGGWGNDVILASMDPAAHPDWIEGGPNNDHICGTDANDTILGGAGDLGLPFLVAYQPLAVLPPSNDGYHDTMAGCDPAGVTYTTPTPGIISGQVYDVDTGLGLDNWTVNLLDSMGHVAASQVTADVDVNHDGTIEPQTESGQYTFTNVHPGMYTVQAVLQPPYVQVTTNQKITIKDGQFAENAAIGVHLNGATIEGRKFDDVNGLGLDTGDSGPSTPGLNNWRIDLLDAGGNVVATQLTSGTGLNAGHYAFTNLAPGTYTVEEEPQPGWVQSYPPLGPIDTGLTVMPAFAADQLVVSYTVNTTTPHVGDTVTFTASVTNPAGDGPINNVQVSGLMLPTGVMFGTATPSRGSYSTATGIWMLPGLLLGGSTATLQITATATASSLTLLAPTKMPILPIPDDGGSTEARSQIKVAGMTGTTDSLQVTFNIAHPEDDQLSALLQSPTGVQIPLFTHVGGTNPNFTGTVFTDAAIPSIDGFQLAVTPPLLPPTVPALLVDQAVDNPTPPVGTPVHFTLAITNPSGAAPENDLSVSAVLPAGVSFVSASPDQGSYNAQTGVWTISGALNGGSTAHLQLTAKAGYNLAVALPATAGLELVTNAVDIVPSGNVPLHFTVSVTNIGTSPLAITPPAGSGLLLTADTVTYGAGGMITYMATVQNEGAGPLSSVPVSALLPPGVTFGSATASPSGSYNASLGIWTLPASLAVGGTASLTITATRNAMPVSVLLPAGVTFNSSGGDGIYSSATEVWTVPGNLTYLGTATLNITATVNSFSLPPVAPFSGSYRPEQPLGSFYGQDPNGKWTLTVLDNRTGMAGVIQNWSLTVGTTLNSPLTFHIALPDPTNAPPLDAWLVTVKPGQIVDKVDFGNYKPVTVKGQKLNDVNGTGVASPNDPGVNGVTVQLWSGNVEVATQATHDIDLNGDGVIQPTTESGWYSFSDVPPGPYTVAEVVPAGWVQTFSVPGDPPTTTLLSSTATSSSLGKPVTLQAAVSPNPAGGTVTFLSGPNTLGTATVNAAGVATLTITFMDPGTFPVTAYFGGFGAYASSPSNSITETISGTLQPGIPVQFDMNAPGSPTQSGYIAVVPRDSWIEVRGYGWSAASSVQSFDNGPLAGNPLSALEEDGAYSTASPGTFLVDLQPGTYQVVLTIGNSLSAVSGMQLSSNSSLVPLNGYSPTALSTSAGNFIQPAFLATVTGSQLSLEFQNSIGQPWDLNGLSITPLPLSPPPPPPTGMIQGMKFNDLTGIGTFTPSDPGLGGVTIYADLNNSGGLDSGEPAAVTGASGQYTLNLPAGTYYIREVVPPGWTQTYPSTGVYQVTVTAGQVVSGINFGNYGAPKTAEIDGTVFNDQNNNGQDDGEPGLGGVKVYADLNYNGKFDAGEPTAITNPGGQYALTLLTTGGAHSPPTAYDIREVVPTGWAETFPGGGVYHELLTPGQVISGIDFGDYQTPRMPQPGTAQGTKFDDLNGNGLREPSEPGLGGFTIYVDLHCDGTLDPGDPNTVTAADGTYTLAMPATPMPGIQATANAGISPATSAVVSATITNPGAGYTVPPVVIFSGGGGSGAAGVAVLGPNCSVVSIIITSGGSGYTSPPTVTLGPPDGSYIIREVVPMGWTQTYPASGFYTYNPAALGDTNPNGPPNVRGLDFGNTLKLPPSMPDGSDMIGPRNGNDLVYGDNHFVKYASVLTSGIVLNDTIYPGVGNETIDGGTGGSQNINTVVQAIANSQNLSNVLLTGQGNDTLVNIQQGMLTSTGSGATLNAHAFTAGPVTLVAGLGNDILMGTSGTTTYQFPPLVTSPSSTTVVAYSPLAIGEINTLDFTNVIEPLTLNMMTNTGAYGFRTISSTDWPNFQTVLGGMNTNNITGNAGLQNLLVGGPSSNTITGGSGNDTIEAAAGTTDQFNGGSGPDTFKFNDHWGTATVNGGAGSGTLDFSAVTANLQVTIDNHGAVTVTDGMGDTVTAMTANYIATILGGSGNDTFVLLDGGELRTGSGMLDGGPGTNLLDYSQYTSAVSVNLGAGTATGLAGIANFQKVLGGMNSSTLTGGSGIDTLQAVAGMTTLAGGSGQDIFTFRNNWGSAVVNVGTGTSVLDFSAIASPLLVNVTVGGVSATVGLNTVTSTSDAFITLFGGQGNDTFFFTAPLNLGSGTVVGGPHTNTIIQKSNANQLLTNTLLSAGGSNTASLVNASQAMLLGGSSGSTLDASAFSLGPVTLTGGNGNDCLLGGNGNDVLQGGPFNNTIGGGNGNDTYIETPHSGTDILQEDAGSVSNGIASRSGIDTIDLSAFATPMTIDLRQEIAVQSLGFTLELQDTAGGDGHASFENLIGGNVQITLFGGSGNDSISAGNGNDLVIVGSGNVSISLGDGNDTVLAGNGNDSVRVGNGADSITLGNGNSTVMAGGGNDAITVGSGNNSIRAGNGSDTINTGLGRDTITATGMDTVNGIGYPFGINAAMGTTSLSVVPPAMPSPPLLKTAYDPVSGNTIVSGTMTGTPSTTYTLTFSTDPGGLSLGSAPVTTDTTGTSSFTIMVSALAPVGASVTATATDPLNNTSAYAADVVVQSFSNLIDLSVTKMVNNPTPAIGSNIIYTVTVTNPSFLTANGVQLVDLLPPGLTFVSASPSQGSYDASSGDWTVGDLPLFGSASLMITATVEGVPPTLHITPGGTATEVSSATTLVVSSSVDHPVPFITEVLHFTATLANTGTNPASGLQVTGILPAALTLNNVTSTSSAGSFDSSTGIWTVDSLAAASQATLQITATVSAMPPPAYTITNMATVTPVQSTSPFLFFGNSVDNPTPQAGSIIHFSASVFAAAPASRVQATGLLPAGVTFVSASASQGNYDPKSGSWQVGDLPAFGFATLMITAKVDGLKITPTATLTPADLVVANSVDNPTPKAGDTIHITATVTNTNPPGSPGVGGIQVQNLLPPGLTFSTITALATQGSYGAGIWSGITLVGGAQATLQITATVSALPHFHITNTATVLPADLVVHSSVSDVTTPPNGDSPVVGDNITITASVTEPAGNGDSGIVVTGLLPAGWTLANITATPGPGGSFDASKGIWTIGTLAGGATATLTIHAKVTALPVFQITNVATVTPVPTTVPLKVTNTVDYGTLNSGDTINFTTSVTDLPGAAPISGVQATNLTPSSGVAVVSATPTQGSYNPGTGTWTTDLASASTTTLHIGATLTGSPSPLPITPIATVMTPSMTIASLSVSNMVNDTTPSANETVTYTVVVTNPAGKDPVAWVQVGSILPAGLIFVSSTATQGSYNPGSGVWTVGAVAGGTLPVTATLKVNALVPTAMTLTPTATLIPPASPSANLVLTSTIDNPSPAPLGTVHYQITVTNPAGDLPVSGLVVNGLALPAGLTFMSASASQGSYGGGVWTVSGSLAGGVTATLTISATASVALSNLPVLPAVPSTQAQAQLVVHNAVTYGTLNANDPITFTVTVTNPAGANLVHGVQVSDPLPAGITFVNQSPGEGSYDFATGTWTVGDLAAGGSATLVISASLNSTVTTSPITPLPTLTPAQSGANLAVSSTVDIPKADPGTVVHFLVTVANPAGANPATGVQVSNLLPAGVSFVNGSTDKGGYDPSTGIWTIGTLPGGTTAMLAITALVDTAPKGTIINTASITAADQPDPVSGNNSASAVITLPTPPAPGLISGIVFFDHNENGIQDLPGDQGLSGWIIDVYDGSGNKVASTASMVDNPATPPDETGNYSFTLPAGNYTVTEESMANWVQTVPGTPSTGYQSYIVSLPSGGTVSNLKFGNFTSGPPVAPGDIGNFKLGTVMGMVMATNNGAIVPLSNWQVGLSSAGGTALTVTTDRSGKFTIGNIGPGTYTLAVTGQPGYVQTMPAPPAVGYSFTVTSGFSAAYNFAFYQQTTITLTTLSNLTVGQPNLNQTITAAGGTGTLTFSLTSGTLPFGLSLSTAGVLSGTPVAMGTFNFTVTATDAIGGSSSQGYAMTINPPVTFTMATLASWTVNQGNYSQTIGATGGTGSATFSASGLLPPGLTLSSGGVLSGMPLAAGTYTFNVTATDSVGALASQSFTILINPPPSITTATLLNWTLGKPGYLQTIGVAGGTGSMTFATTAGQLPLGLHLSSGGVISGTPDGTGSFSFVVTATDAAGATASQGYTVVIINAVKALVLTLPTTAVAGTAFSLTVSATDGAGNIAGNVNGTIPLSSSAGGISPTSVTLVNGTATIPVTLTVAGAQTITVGIPGTLSASASIAVSPGSFQQYLVTTLLPGPTVTAGNNFGLEVRAADQFGNLITGGYSGPTTVTATVSPSAAGSFPSMLTIGSDGLGIALESLQKVGTYTIAVTGGGFSGSSAPVTVTPGLAAKLMFAVQPTSAPTGDLLAPVVVDITDAYGNVITTGSDSTDVVNLSPASGPGGFTASSQTVAAAVGGVVTFSNLTLIVPGSYVLGAATFSTTLATFGFSNTFAVTPLQVLPGSFASSPSGFSLTFNAPFLVNSTTPVLFGTGFGATAPVPSVTLTGPNGPVEGSLVLNPGAAGTTSSLTFVETDTASMVNNATPVLPDGIYTVVVHGTAAGDGFQALNTGGGFLDGIYSGSPGHDFTTTFTVNAAAVGDDKVWVPATADGPLQPLEAPGNNQVGGGYPVYLSDTTGKVTSVNVTFNYNPTMLSVTDASSNSSLPGSTFALNTAASSPGHAVLTYTGPASDSGSLRGGQVALGYLTATVLNSSAAIPIYKGKDLLHLSGIAINSGAIPAVGGDALHVVAFVGDADGNGHYSSNDAVLITRTALQSDSGFTAYPLVDPVIVGDTDGSGFFPADAGLQVNEAGVGFPTNNLASPPIPSGANVTPIGNNVDPSLIIPGVFQVGADGTLTVPVNIDDAHPPGSTGLIAGHLALTYDPRRFHVSASDVHLGSVLTAGSGWSIDTTIDQTTGQIAISLASTTPISTSVGGSLVIIDFHQVGSGSEQAAIALVASVSPNGQPPVSTELEDMQGTFTLTPAPTGAPTIISAIPTTTSRPPAAVTEIPNAVPVEADYERADLIGSTHAEVIPHTPTAIALATNDEIDRTTLPRSAASAHETSVVTIAAVSLASTSSGALAPWAGPALPFVNLLLLNGWGLGPVAAQSLADPLFQAWGRGTAIPNDLFAISRPAYIGERWEANQVFLSASEEEQPPRRNWEEESEGWQAQDIRFDLKCWPMLAEEPLTATTPVQPTQGEHAALDQFFARSTEDTEFFDIGVDAE
jgi:uncharacterized repeat protein (TIGR01451 family)